MRGLAGDIQSVSIRLRLGDNLRTDHARRARTVLHHKGPAHTLGQLLRHDAPNNVSRTACGEANDYAHHA